MNRPESDAAANTAADATHAPPTSASETRAESGPAGVPVPPPKVLGGYIIVRLLGAGGMGAVYHARDEKLDRDIALKTMKPEIAARPEAVERFLREARAAAKVGHDNVIPILHIGEDNGTPYIAMPLLEGEPLDRWLKREPVPPLGVTLKVGRETADGLTAAHARGLVHRDIKPANLWIEGEAGSSELAKQFRRVKVLDFGLARPAADDTQLTGTGAVLGTPAYMSPEQGRAEPVDSRTDLFSLGVVLYRMTTGRQPFTGATALAVLTSLAVENPPAPVSLNPQVPQALSDLVMRMLSKNRDDRPASAAEVATALRAIGKQVTAARKAASAPPAPAGEVPVGGPISQSVPVVVAHPLPVEVNPFTELGVTDPLDDPEQTAHSADTPPEEPKPAPQKRRGAGMWIAVGLAVCVAVAAVIAVKYGGPKPKEPVPDAGDTAKGDPKPNPPAPKPVPKTDPDRAVAEWVLSVNRPLTLRIDGKPAAVKPGDRLPDKPFRVIGVYLGGNPKLSNADLKALQAATDLETIAIFHNPQITDLSFLTGMKKLRVLDANTIGVSDAGLTPLAGLTALEELQIGCTRVTDDGLRHLSGLTNLRLLSLAGAPVTDAGLEHLKTLNNLGFLRLGQNKVTADGVAQLAKALPNCTIHSDHGMFEPKGGGDRATAAWVLSVGGSVRLVTADGRGVMATAAKDLPAGSWTVDWINLAHCGEKVRDVDLERLKWPSGLTLLALGGTQITDAGLAHLKHLVGLRGLALWTTAVTDDGLKHLQGMGQLFNLDIANTAVTNDGLIHLKSLNQISNLGLARTKVTDSGLDHLLALDKLAILNLTQTKVTAAGVQKLAKALPKCKIVSDHGVLGPPAADDRDVAEWVMSVGGAATIRADGGEVQLRAGKGLPVGAITVTAVELGAGAKVTDAGLVNLKGLTAVTRVALSGSAVTDAGLEHLTGLSNLTGLSLTGTKVTAEGVARLKTALPKCNVQWEPPKK